MKSVCAFVVRTWGHLFIASKKKNTKNTCEPTNFPYFTIVRWDLKRKIDLDWLFEYSDIDLLCFPRPKTGPFF